MVHRNCQDWCRFNQERYDAGGVDGLWVEIIEDARLRLTTLEKLGADDGG